MRNPCNWLLGNVINHPSSPFTLSLVSSYYLDLSGTFHSSIFYASQPICRIQAPQGDTQALSRLLKVCYKLPLKPFPNALVS